MAGAVAVQTSAKGKHALRKGPSKKTSVVGAIDLDESEGALPVQVQLQHALAKSSARVIDLFKEFDVDGDGTVSAKEFRTAMPLLILNVPRADVDALFSSWDPDGSGTLTLKELEKVLRRPMELDAKLKAGAVCMRYPREFQGGAFTNPDEAMRRKAIDLTKAGCVWG